MNDLPANQKLRQKDAYYSIVLAPLEHVTASLRRGDPWAGEDLAALANRCRALADAFDDRMKAAGETE